MQRARHGTTTTTPHAAAGVTGSPAQSVGTSVTSTPPSPAAAPRRVPAASGASSVANGNGSSDVVSKKASGGGHKRMHRCRVMSYSVGHFFNDMVAATWFSYLLVFLQTVIGLSSTSAGVVMFAGQATDAAGTLAVGILCDKTTGCPSVGLGRRKSWNFPGVIAVAACFVSVFAICVPCEVDGTDEAGISMMTLTISYAIAAAFLNLGWASVQVSHMSLIPDLSPVAEEQVLLNSGRYCFTILANLTVFTTFYVLLHFVGEEGFGKNGFKFRVLALIVVGLGSVASTCFLLGTKEPPLPEDDDDEEEQDAVATPPCSAGGLKYAQGQEPLLANVNAFSTTREGRDVEAASVGGESTASGVRKPKCKGMTPLDWLKRPLFYSVGFVYMCTRLTVNQSQVYIPFFVLKSTDLPVSQVAMIPFVVYCSSLISTLVVKFLNQKIGRRLTYVLGVGQVVGGCACLYWAQDISPVALVYVGMVLVGAGNSALMVTSVAMEADLIGRNVECGAFVFGALSLSDKLSNGASIMIIQQLSSSSGNLHDFYRVVVSGVPAVCAVLAVLVMVMAPLPKIHMNSHSDAETAASQSISGESNSSNLRAKSTWSAAGMADEDGSDLPRQLALQLSPGQWRGE